VAAHLAALYASERCREGPAGRRHFGSGSGGGGALPVDRSSAPRGGLREGEDLSKGATGSVGDITIRLVQRTTTPTHELTPPETKRRRPSGENRDSSRLARSAPTGALLEVGNAFTGYPASPRVFTVPNPVRACWARAAIEGAIRLVRARRSRMVGSRGCSLTTSRLQRLVRGILSASGPNASAGGHASDEHEPGVPSP
jgi:hypothetical protein